MPSFKRWCALTCLLTTLLLAPSAALAWQGVVARVSDGDTVVVARGRKAVKLRLQGIDAPELSQPYGQQAGQYMRYLVLGKTVEVDAKETDAYKRTVAVVFRLPDRLNVNETMIWQGYAWHYVRYAHSPRLAWLEDGAARAHRGLWADPRPVPPWQWRRRHPRGGQHGSRYGSHYGSHYGSPGHRASYRWLW